MYYDPKKFDGFDRPDETPKTFADLKPPGYWSKTLGYGAQPCGGARVGTGLRPLGQHISIKAPTQCALWKKPELLDEPMGNRFELLPRRR